MEGKRTAQAEAGARRGGAAVWIGLAAAAVLAAAAGFCVYANTYSGVFPGVTMAGIELEGKGLKELRDTLTQALPSSLDGQVYHLVYPHIRIHISCNFIINFPDQHWVFPDFIFHLVS